MEYKQAHTIRTHYSNTLQKHHNCLILFSVFHFDIISARDLENEGGKDVDFQTIWNRIVSCAGEQFYTKTNLPFTYKMVNDCVVPDRTNYPLARSNFEKAAQIVPLNGPGQINNIVRGPAYVYAILTDKRIG